MSTHQQTQRSPWLVPIIVAIVGAIGVIGAAVLPGLLNPPDNGNTSAGTAVTADDSEDTNGDSDSDAPTIGGDYYLDPGNARIIEIREAGTDTYTASERQPADWPFTGEVRWDGEQFTGPATFESGVQMEIEMEPADGGRLNTAFAFTDATRVDYHVLVPVFE